MNFSIFKSPKSQHGELCTYGRYLEIANSPELLRLCNDIAAEKDPDRRGELKKRLPVITWQAFFPARRIAQEAQPSGLFMLDIDHVDEPGKLYADKIAGRLKELSIVYVGMTASRHGLRIVARCRPEFQTIEECQRWLAQKLAVDYDGVCKDWARCSFLVHDSYTYFMDANAIWQEPPATGSLYATPSTSSPSKLEGVAEHSKDGDVCPQPTTGHQPPTTDPSQISTYKGLPYDTIAREWLLHTGGEPQIGERNSRLFKLAIRLRYITDFNADTLLRVMPRYGLPEEEMRALIHSALNAARAADMPLDLRETLDKIDRRIKLGDSPDEEEIPDIITSTDKVPPLPPVFRQWFEVAPDDFKRAVTLCQLPILGALGSRLRAEYLDGRLHSPSFQVSLEAPQASGKSFLVRLVDYELQQMIDSDNEQRERERAYNERLQQIKLTNTKITQKQREELGERPKGIIRFVPATISITMLLKRMEAAQGLHLFALAEEIDTVLKAFKRSFSSFSDALRVSFDNGLYGQDYASENSFSGILPLYYNALFSGTPKAMCRFYPDVEDGLVSRVLFVSLPDQFGKPMPVWRRFNDEQRRIVDQGLVKLNEITLQGSEVQPEHVMRLDWLNRALEAWIRQQQIEAVKQDDRTRDIFCRRAAVVGFRAGMLAWFLWDEKGTPTIRRNVAAFAIWVANSMLNQHLLRFNVSSTDSNVNRWEDVYRLLKDEFTRDELVQALSANGSSTPAKQVIYRWKLLGCIETLEVGTASSGNRQTVRFRKTKN